MYEPIIVNDGDPAFGIKGTFQIHNTIYVTTDEADEILLSRLTDFGYRLNTGLSNQEDFYIAQQPHKQTRDEIMAEVVHNGGLAIQHPSNLFIDLRYINAQRLSLKGAVIHEKIIVAASQRRDTGYYNRPHDQMSDVALSRMSGFVKNMVDVPFNDWQDFIIEARQYHAIDFIRGLAHWASRRSDNSPRMVRGGPHGEDETISGTDEFNIIKALPIPFFGKGPQKPSPF